MNGRGLPRRKHAIFKHDFEFEITSEIHVLSTIFLLLKSPIMRQKFSNRQKQNEK